VTMIKETQILTELHDKLKAIGTKFTQEAAPQGLGSIPT